MKHFVIFLSLAFLLGGCDWFSNDEEPQSKDFDLKSLEMLSATDRFGWDLLETINEDAEEGENVVISSLSVAQALGMTTNGAAGTTLDQMLSVMDFGEVDEMNEAFKNIRAVLPSADPKVDVEIANSVWYREDLPAKDSFRSVVEEYYDTSYRGLDFRDKDGSKKIINDWVDKKTRGKIPSIIDEVKDDQFMFLVNAVYFLGKWQYKFDKADTKDEAFHLSDGSEVQVPTMHQEADLEYYAGSDCRAVKLPYGNGRLYMLVALPQGDLTVDSLVNQMDNQKWSTILTGMQEQGIALAMPRFEIDCKFQLNKPLQNMGMELPFSRRDANFSNMIETHQVCIDEVLHKTYIKADEEGTEAAAATSVGMVVTSIGSDGPMPFRIDRPFLFAIAEEKSGAILFSGKIENPL
ncbi:MAG: serpin family protein [Bacteroidota bacterium]